MFFSCADWETAKENERMVRTNSIVSDGVILKHCSKRFSKLASKKVDTEVENGFDVETVINKNPLPNLSGKILGYKRTSQAQEEKAFKKKLKLDSTALMEA